MHEGVNLLMLTKLAVLAFLLAIDAYASAYRSANWDGSLGVSLVIQSGSFISSTVDFLGASNFDEPTKIDEAHQSYLTFFLLYETSCLTDLYFLSNNIKLPITAS